MENLDTIQTVAEIRQTFFPSTSTAEDKSAEEYLDYLSSKGVVLNQKLFPSVFQLKNGLPYTGMAVRETVGAGEVLIRVPEELVLSTAKAFEDPQLCHIFRTEEFFKSGKEVQQDRILIVYSLYLLSKKEVGNPWYEMITKLPKECDIACFWKQEQLDSFKDGTIKSAAKLDLLSFEKEWQAFERLQHCYEILQSSQFNKQTYRIVFIALNNRAFGTKVKYISLVPMAELFNHHCSKVFYNIQKEKKTELIDDNFDNQSETSSFGSCDSTDYLEDGQFAYDKLEYRELNWQVEDCYNLNKKGREVVVKKCENLLFRIDEELNWEDFTVLFVGHLIFKVKVIRKQYLVGRKVFQKAMYELIVIQKALEKYKKNVSEYYLRVNKKPYIAPEQKKNPEEPSEPKYTKDYQSIIIKTSRFDRTEVNQQIYFKYGGYSNRSLLLRYGFAIEGNKYEHAWVSFDVAQGIADFPDVLQRIMTKKLSLKRKFKLYHHRLCIDLIIFFRLNSWTFWGQKAIEQIMSVINIHNEIVILEQVADVLRESIEIYDEDYDLTDKNLNYHEYFTTVYHVQKLRIYQKQVRMIEKLIEVLTNLNEGDNIQKATQILTKSQKIVLAPYLTSIKS